MYSLEHFLAAGILRLLYIPNPPRLKFLPKTLLKSSSSVRASSSQHKEVANKVLEALKPLLTKILATLVSNCLFDKASGNLALTILSKSVFSAGTLSLE